MIEEECPLDQLDERTAALVESRPWADGRPVLILGGGPSLTARQVAFCYRRRRVPRCIAINDSFRLAPWADALYACDLGWWARTPEAAEFHGLKFGLARVTRHYPGVWGWLPTVAAGGKNHGFDPRPGRMRTGGNGGHQAIIAAVQLGARKIILLGYDMQAAADGRCNWHDYDPTTPNPTIYPRFRAAFDTLKHDLIHLGVTVLNATPGTALEAFPPVPLAVALAMLAPEPPK